ncbi:tyrosine-type recombinase/integrase [Sulfitobacter pacificus]|uniref:Core-binding (CB) domain-containing protein n=1 Tax=Sulfitobacter pacificus TaxID=1499314 RepID=A0ABQ5VGQ6_9RHOB|nr:integrase arm-type DNA-binding domain-containing protein [Sulfitobacter pacificus]GLQ26259.1 hypothetical protein GCM10007927_10620 [Sulfitobacter pacificus]
MPLSDIQVRNLKPREKAYKVFDFEGLFVLVKPNGSKLWQMKYRLYGKERLFSIGVYPDVTLAQARKAKEEARAKLATEIDPSEAKQTEKRMKREEAGQTFEKIGAEFLAKQRKEGKTKATLDKTEYHLKLANRDFGRRPITEITAPMILKTLRKVEAKGTYETAHRLRARIGSVFRYAVASGVAEIDPTYALRDALIPTDPHPPRRDNRPQGAGPLDARDRRFRGASYDPHRAQTAGNARPTPRRDTSRQMGRDRLCQ